MCRHFRSIRRRSRFASASASLNHGTSGRTATRPDCNGACLSTIAETTALYLSKSSVASPVTATIGDIAASSDAAISSRNASLSYTGLYKQNIHATINNGSMGTSKQYNKCSAVSYCSVILRKCWDLKGYFQKLKFRKYSAIHSNYSCSKCAMSN